MHMWYYGHSGSADTTRLGIDGAISHAHPRNVDKMPVLMRTAKRSGIGIQNHVDYKRAFCMNIYWNATMRGHAACSVVLVESLNSATVGPSITRILTSGTYITCMCHLSRSCIGKSWYHWERSLEGFTRYVSWFFSPTSYTPVSLNPQHHW